MDIQTIKAAIRKNRGGWETCEDDAAFQRLWESLREETQAEYVATLAPPPAVAPEAVPEPAVTTPPEPVDPAASMEPAPPAVALEAGPVNQEETLKA